MPGCRTGQDSRGKRAPEEHRRSIALRRRSGWLRGPGQARGPVRFPCVVRRYAPAAAGARTMPARHGLSGVGTVYFQPVPRSRVGGRRRAGQRPQGRSAIR
ncbi:hypothetical protein TVNIR_2823 [Thioalkalivibrio nitratireducens DSM 14787]|uniref:Uncharacterized protein n=1 Tax=Thioalkalivibrio nitratireducens (strain DSM 14787 / UNIQEM 213 / ALEN2) TaxID=1255043 RepID=L0E1G4_THIND|nr:hypothetical protein TVNIR_2823 [Thioalkalivibrio nitratireducens DSM 14787]